MTASRLAVDIGSELAEGFALPPGGIPLAALGRLRIGATGRRFHPRHAAPRFDHEVIPVLSSAHLACGLHSGDPAVIRQTVATLAGRPMDLGAHPAYPDVFDFGQSRVELSHDDLVAVLLYQFGALQGVLSSFGRRISHVKCHGALAFDVANQPWACDAMVEAIKIFDAGLILLAMAGTASVARARAAGIKVIEEGFADRGYDARGQLVPRDHPKALHTDPRVAARQVVGMARDGFVTTVDGERIALRARSFCLHADTPAAGRFARALADELAAEGIDIRPLSWLDDATRNIQ